LAAVLVVHFSVAVLFCYGCNNHVSAVQIIDEEVLGSSLLKGAYFDIS